MHFTDNDTIAQISTPLGAGGISIIRISGPESFALTEKIFVRADGKPFSKQKSNEIRYGHIVNSENETLDEVLVSKFAAKKTYTTQDTVEINCHGGAVCAKEILELVINSGARAAEAGEFTKRAFLNGRIDLVQAQAVSDIIDAKTSAALKAGQRSLSGEISEKIEQIKELILSLLVSISVTIEYPEYDVPELTNDEILEKLGLIREKLNSLYETYKKGDILKEGVNVAICGKPNVGKSTLLNTLTGRQRAIVTKIAGTTRDVVSEYVNIGGIPVKLMDTAGIRESSDEVEAIGVGLSLKAIDDADFVIFVYDISSKADDEDQTVYAQIKHKKHIAVLNKSDTQKSLTEQQLKESFAKTFTSPLSFENIIVVSALNKQNTQLIEQALAESFLSDNQSDASGAAIVNVRHKTLIAEALKSVDAAEELIKTGMPVDFAETDIAECREKLLEITGETASEEIIDEIFKNFCLGK